MNIHIESERDVEPDEPFERIYIPPRRFPQYGHRKPVAVFWPGIALGCIIGGTMLFSAWLAWHFAHQGG